MRHSQRAFYMAGDEAPQKRGSSGDQNCCGTFRERGKADKESETDAMKNARFGGDNNFGAKRHCGGEHRGERHVWSCGVAESDDADRCRHQK